MLVYKDGRLVGASADSDAEELVTLTGPEPGASEVYAVQYALVPPRTERDVLVHSFVVPSAAAGNLTATPASQPVALGQTATVTIAWNGLTAGTRYLGFVEYGDRSTAIGATIVTVNA